MSGPRIGSLCTGVGGLEMAVMSVLPDAEVAWHAQYEPPDKSGKPDVHQWAARVLEHRFPGVPNHGDITAIDYSHVERVDILTAGFPCKNISLAGDRTGLLPGNSSGVWNHVARGIAALRPSLVFIENVRSLTSARAYSDLESCPRCVGDGERRPALRALGAVLGDLAGLGFDAEWVCLPASGVDAPHQRERAFILAWPADADADELGRYRRPGCHAETDGRNEPAHGGNAAASPGRIALMPTPAARDWKSDTSNLMDHNSRPLNEFAVNLLPTPKASDGPHGGPNQRSARGVGGHRRYRLRAGNPPVGVGDRPPRAVPDRAGRPCQPPPVAGLYRMDDGNARRLGYRRARHAAQGPAEGARKHRRATAGRRSAPVPP